MLGSSEKCCCPGGLQSFETVEDEKAGQRSIRSVRLSPSFYDQLRRHPVPIWEPAFRYIANRSMAIDVYIWLAYRLHSLNQPLAISWPALHGQFGPGLRTLRNLRRTSQSLFERPARFTRMPK